MIIKWYRLTTWDYIERKKRTMDSERLRKKIAFILEADKEKNILRQTHLSENEGGKMTPSMPGIWHLWFIC